ncbi:CDP-diacylglycerol--serine O-phosphatidyltransferase [Arenimonas caeni]|jgi:CDP-diacylglycerol--serine O-phosphatidyltransferase|uniref:CDP-diacylglycerol--serine O-phosphatidyltransferase n=1 Tax=Arenimonas caeni TaxID=2058085 RepID=UPI002A35F189|nr:CDP-diacylglycerol--serine O-phosphatidyltransferase [Arenimonas caeni]MDY0022249.1 CDP-diacylglycerol--serine O-phosphatidyltransferase [Arenimonas caeni]
MEPTHEPGAPRGRGIYLLPNLLTTGGLFAGFYAILAAASGNFENACIAVFVAALFDGVDGRVARMTGTTSEFGVQYDSLADLVSFGMAPSLVMYHWALVGFRADGPVLAKVGWAAAFLYAACAALRLARFNTQVGSTDKRWFIGLASPAAAGLVVSFVWAMNSFGYSGEGMRWLALVVTVAAGLLMVSRIRFYSFKGLPKGDRVPFYVMALVVVIIAVLFIAQAKGLLALAALYAVSGPAWWLWAKLRRRKSAA